MPFNLPQSDSCGCSAHSGLPVQVINAVKRQGIEKNFRAARGLAANQASASIRKRPGLGDLSTLTTDLNNGDWNAVLNDSIPLLFGAGALYLTWKYVFKTPKRKRG